MHENNFEKEVREKMDQFGVEPSATVWTSVEKEINKDKKDRRPILWLFFFSGLVLLGTGYYFNSYNDTKNRNSATKEHKGRKENIERQSGDSASIIKDNKNLKESLIPEHSLAGRLTDPPNEDTENSSGNKQNGEAFLLRDTREKGPETLLNNQKRNSKLTDAKAADEKNGHEAGENGQNKVKTGLVPVKTNVVDSPEKRKISVVPENKKLPEESAAEKKGMGKGNQHMKADSWKIGFNGTAGISNINQMLFESSNTAIIYYAPATTGGGSTNLNAPQSSKTSPGFSFGAGAFVSRLLSNRISFQAGLNYHYYSTKINTGKIVNTPVYGYSTSTQFFLSNSYYQSGNDREYLNQYHFIELPVSVNFQFNKSRKTKVIWQAGLSLSYLINSNSLYFDPSTSVYFENTQQFNRTQFNASTAILIGFHLHQNEFQLGPHLQYGLTGLSKTGAGNPGHLLYYGVGISFIPGKK